MSIPALWTPTKRLIVEDELESFFNVLLYLAVRFLPHDCERVPELVRMYFEDCSSFSSHHPGPGTFKILSLTAGRIPLGLRSLTFTGAGRHSHPLNFILSTILGWFQAFYDTIPVEKEPVVFSTSEPFPNASTAVYEFDDDDDELLFPGRSSRSPSKPSPEYLESLRSAREAIVQNIRTHQSMVTLFKIALSHEDLWPLSDKMHDQLCRKPDPMMPTPVNVPNDSTRGDGPSKYSDSGKSRKHKPAKKVDSERPATQGKQKCAKEAPRNPTRGKQIKRAKKAQSNPTRRMLHRSSKR